VGAQKNVELNSVKWFFLMPKKNDDTKLAYEPPQIQALPGTINQLLLLFYPAKTSIYMTV